MEKSLRGALFVLCALPFAWLAYGAFTGALGPDPAEQVMHITGEWGLRMLALTLLVSPLRAWTGWKALLHVRRMLGLFVFFYASLHLLGFLQLYTGWSVAALLEELLERPYIAVGFSAWLLFLPLAITSTRGFQRRLGRNWVRLHRLVYPAAVLACLHLLWLSRSDIGEALLYGIIFALLLLWRLRRYRGRQLARSAV